MIKRFLNLVIANAILFFAISADAQFGFGKPKSGLQPMRSAGDARLFGDSDKGA